MQREDGGLDRGLGDLENSKGCQSNGVGRRGGLVNLHEGIATKIGQGDKKQICLA